MVQVFFKATGIADNRYIGVLAITRHNYGHLEFHTFSTKDRDYERCKLVEGFLRWVKGGLPIEPT